MSSEVEGDTERINEEMIADASLSIRIYENGEAVGVVNVDRPRSPTIAVPLSIFRENSIGWKKRVSPTVSHFPRRNSPKMSTGP